MELPVAEYMSAISFAAGVNAEEIDINIGVETEIVKCVMTMGKYLFKLTVLFDLLLDNFLYMQFN